MPRPVANESTAPTTTIGTMCRSVCARYWPTVWRLPIAASSAARHMTPVSTKPSSTLRNSAAISAPPKRPVGAAGSVACAPAPETSPKSGGPSSA